MVWPFLSSCSRYVVLTSLLIVQPAVLALRPSALRRFHPYSMQTRRTVPLELIAIPLISTVVRIYPPTILHSSATDTQ